MEKKSQFGSLAMDLQSNSWLWLALPHGRLVVLKRTVLGGIKPVGWWFLRKPFLHILMLWARPRRHCKIRPYCGSLGQYSLFVSCCLDSDDIEAVVDGQLEIVKCSHGLDFVRFESERTGFVD